MSEGFLPGFLLRICGGGDTHHFQLVGHSALPTQPWSLGTMECREGVPEAEPTTRGYLGATGGEKPGNLQPSLGQGQSWWGMGLGGYGKATSVDTEGGSFRHWVGGIQDAKRGRNRAVVSTLSPPTPWGTVQVTQGDSWDLGSTFGPGQPVLPRPVGSGLHGVPVAVLHYRPNHLLRRTLVFPFLHRGNC